ncbi:HET-domain-containing protein [Fusarium austroafricanum]|uniref:HET-domain-containing protein n=1 Tax=Fusarium austroafricanum TaxID=2364996 RepID=A0A8H4KC02_9HYPO|nr:HET-domain-containing protein [Fusarium austroafricanum]
MAGQVAPPDSFKHEAFPDYSIHRLRIVTLMKADQAEPISCTIQNEELTGVEEYTAISHSWSHRGKLPKQKISLAEKPFEVSDNIYCLLKRLRKTTEDVKLWIDVLCIRQPDDEKTDKGVEEAKKEKSEQVKIMGEIYKKATLCVIWLGETDDNGVAVKFLKDLGNCRKLSALDCFQGKDERSVIKEDHKDKFKAFEQLLDLSWWKRVWVIQEMVLPQKIEFRYGSAEFGVETLEGVRNLLEKQDKEDRELRDKLTGPGFDPLMVLEVIVVPMVQTREQWRKGPELTLPALRQRFPASDAGWKQDLFYGLLGMVQDWGRQQPLEVDYTLSPGQAIRKAVYHCLLVEQRTNFLHGSRERRSMDGCPSWLADFHVQSIPIKIVWGEKRRFNISKRFSASGRYLGLGTKTRLHPHGTLIMEAINVDKIGQVGDMFMFDPHGELHKVPDVLKQWMKMVFGNDVEWPEEPPQAGSLKDSFWRTIINDCVPESSPDLPQPSPYRAPRDEDYTQLKRLWPDLSRNTQLSSAASSNGLSMYDLTKSLETTVFEKAPNLAYHFLFCLWKRRMITTSTGLIGLAPQDVKVGDVVRIPFGSSVPYIFRPCCDGAAVLIGNAYVHGVMMDQGPRGSTEEISLH